MCICVAACICVWVLGEARAMIFLELDLQAINYKPLDRKLVLLQEKYALFTTEASLHPHEGILNDEYEEGGIAACPMYIKMLSKYELLLIFTIILLFLKPSFQLYKENFQKVCNEGSIRFS